MKRSKLALAAILLSGTVLFTSCIGSFGLTKNVLSWNNTVGSKFVNELVFLGLCIVPVYEITVLADVLVLNSVEFWSGRNPMDASVKTVQGKNGEYLVESNKDGYKITNTESKAVVELNFNEKDQSWSAVSQGKEVKILSFNDANNVTMYLPDGSTMEVELSQAGVIAFQQYMDGLAPMFAVR